MAMHTAGSELQWHPHLHTIALDGAVLDDGHFVELGLVDQELVQEFFEEKVFAFLLKAGLIEQDTVLSMRAWEHTGFNCYAAEPISAADADARQFLARYLKKAPLTLKRLSIDESGAEPVVRYAAAPAEGAEEGSVSCFSPLEFLAQLSVHVPGTWEQTSRYFGVYSPRTRGAKRRDEEFRKLVQNNFQPLAQEEPRRVPSASWARCIKLVFELNPLTCPKCGGQMKIKAFIHSPHEIERLTKHLGLCSWRAPPKFESSPQGVWVDTSPEYSQVH